MGENSRRSTCMARCTVASVQGCPVSSASVWLARTGVAATPPTPIEARTIWPPSRRSATARHRAEMSSSKRLDTLYTRLNS